MSRVDLLGVLFMISGALTMLIGASTLALGIAAAAIVASAGRAGTGQFGASLTAVTFMTLAVLALIWGGVHLMVGTLVRRRRHWSRHAALMLGTVDLLLLPGTERLSASIRCGFCCARTRSGCSRRRNRLSPGRLKSRPLPKTPVGDALQRVPTIENQAEAP